MAVLTDLEKVRRRRAKRRTLQNLLLLAVFGVMVYFGVTLIRQAGSLSLKTAYSDIRAEVGTGAGYPQQLPGGKISHMEAAGDMLTLLTDTNLYTYNPSGSQMLNAQHGMAKPLMSVARDRVLLCERGGSRLAVYSKSALIHAETIDYTIYNADLSQNGNYGVATNSDASLAQVSVYNKNAEQIFKWYSSRPIIDLALSDSREAMVVGCVDVSDGVYCSGISRFQFSIDKPMGSLDLPGELLLSVEYRGGRILAVTDHRAILLTGELEEIASYAFENTALNRICVPQTGMPVLVFGSFAQEKKLSVVTLTETMKRHAGFSVEHDILDLCADGKYVYIAERSGVRIFGTDGTEIAFAPVSNLESIKLIGETLYCATSTELLALSAKELTVSPEAASSGTDSAGGQSGSSQSESAGGSSKTENASSQDIASKTEKTKNESAPPKENS